MEQHSWDLGTVERRLAIATEAARIGLWDWNLVTGEMVYSRRAKLICGFDTDRDVTLDMARAVTHPDDLPSTWAMSQQAMDPGIRASEPYRYRLVRADTGEVRWVLAYGQATFDGIGSDARCVAYTGTIQDVTEQKLGEDQLAHSEARLRLALDAGDMAVWEVDVGTGTVTHSPKLNMLCGFPPDARPSVAEFQAHYAPGELERIHTLAAEIAARGEKRIEADLRLIWPDGTPKWVRLRAQEVPGSDGQRVIGVLYDITERKYAEERSDLIARELRHRIKNSIAVLQSIASQSIRGHADPEDGLAALSGRLVALAAAASSVSEEDWDNASIVGLVDRVLAPHHDGDSAARFDSSGPNIPLPTRFASTLALALHELATNAVKYGALSVPSGRVSLKWTVDGEHRFMLTWTETGGPSVSPPDHVGFGTRMIERALFVPFKGYAAFQYTSAGLHCRIVASIPL